MSRTITLREFRGQGSIISSVVDATLHDDGSVIIGSQDIGAAVGESFGGDYREYEWTLTIRAADVPALLAALGGADVLLALQERFGGEREAGLQSFLDAHRIKYEFWSRVGE